MTCPINQSLNAYIEGEERADDREDAIAGLATRLEQAAFKAMRAELQISIYAGMTTAADMNNAIDEEMFINIAESLMKTIERG